MANVEFDDVWKRFRVAGRRRGPRPVARQSRDRELLVLLGPSGCGKTTALRMLAGLEEPDGGDIRIGGKSVVGLEPKDRDVALVFQSYALYPAPVGARQHPLPAQGPEPLEGGAGGKGRRASPSMLGIGHLLPRRPAPALRRRAAARRAGPGDRSRAAGLPDGRAAVQPRRQAAGPHPDRAEDAPAAARDDDGLRHPRPGRGDEHGRPDRRPERRASSSRSGRRTRSTTARPTSSSPSSSAARR